MRLWSVAIFLTIFVCSTSKSAMSMQALRVRSSSAPTSLPVKTSEQKRIDAEERRMKRALRAATVVEENPLINDARTTWENIVTSARSVQDFLVCPLTGQPLMDPIIATDGHTYERRAMIGWLNEQKGQVRLSPITGEPFRIIRVRLGAPPKVADAPWRIKPQNKPHFFITDVTVLYAILLYKYGQAPENEEEIFSDPLDRLQLLEEPVILGDGVAYNFSNIHHHLEHARERGLIKNPFHEGPGSEFFHEFMPVAYCPSPLSGEIVQHDQITVHKTMWAIMAFLEKTGKKREKERRGKNQAFRRCWLCRTYLF